MEQHVAGTQTEFLLKLRGQAVQGEANSIAFLRKGVGKEQSQFFPPLEQALVEHIYEESPLSVVLAELIPQQRQ